MNPVAYHEAGHAVAAWRWGIDCLGITIVPDEHRRGHCQIPVCPWLRDANFQELWPTLDDEVRRGLDRSVEHAQYVLFAGPLAEVRCQGWRRPPGQWWGPTAHPTDDIRRAWDLEEKLALLHGNVLGEDARLFAHMLMHSTVDRWLRRPNVWRAVTALATRLEEERSLDGDALYTFFTGCGVRQPRSIAHVKRRGRERQAPTIARR
jgi:hypothetical protein